jgi:hypothetical protein
MTTKKVYLTANNTILIVTARTTNGYVSVTADEIEPLSIETAEERTREYLEDGELWRMAVASESTEMSLSDWVETVINIDGKTSGIDNSLYSARVDIDGTDYIFDSRSCGCLHDDIKALTGEFDLLIALHLGKSIETAEEMIKDIVSDDVDAKVLEYATQIVNN